MHATSSDWPTIPTTASARRETPPYRPVSRLSVSRLVTLATPENVVPSFPVILATAPPGATFPYRICKRRAEARKGCSWVRYYKHQATLPAVGKDTSTRRRIASEQDGCSDLPSAELTARAIASHGSLDSTQTRLARRRDQLGQKRNACHAEHAIARRPPRLTFPGPTLSLAPTDVRMKQQSCPSLRSGILEPGITALLSHRLYCDYSVREMRD